jgi:hypothetical protein
MMDKRTAYEEKLAAQMEEWSAQLALYKAKADKATAEAKIEYNQITEALQRQHNEAMAKLQELKDASDEAWEEVKVGAEKAWTEIKTAFQVVAPVFKDTQMRYEKTGQSADQKFK